jgi:hypothetical protein
MTSFESCTATSYQCRSLYVFFLRNQHVGNIIRRRNLSENATRATESPTISVATGLCNQLQSVRSRNPNATFGYWPLTR